MSTSHTAVIVGKDISNIEGHLRSMKDEINVFKQELESCGHDDEGDANFIDKLPLQNTALVNEEQGDSQVIRPIQICKNDENVQRLPQDDFDIISNKTKPRDVVRDKKVSFSTQQFKDNRTEPFSERQYDTSSGLSNPSLNKMKTKPSTFYFKPSSQWRNGTGKDDQLQDSASPSSEYNDSEISKLIYPSWWFHPVGSVRPLRPMSSSYRENQPRLAYKGPSSEEQKEALSLKLRSDVLKDDLVTGSYVGVPSSGYGTPQYIHNDTNGANTTVMRDALRAKSETATIPTTMKDRPRFNNYLKPVKSTTTESKVRERLLKEHIETQKKHDERLKKIEKVRTSSAIICDISKCLFIVFVKRRKLMINGLIYTLIEWPFTI